MSYASACTCAGFSYRSFAAWKAEVYRNRGPDEPPPSTMLLALREMLDSVDAEWEQRDIAQIESASHKEWPAAAWLLERRDPEHWERHRLRWEPPEGAEQPRQLSIEYVAPPLCGDCG